MKRITEHKNISFSVFDSHIMASDEKNLILMEHKKNFSIWKITEKEFIGNLVIIWDFSACGLPEIAWLVIEDKHGKKVARTYN